MGAGSVSWYSVHYKLVLEAVTKAKTVTRLMNYTVRVSTSFVKSLNHAESFFKKFEEMKVYCQALILRGTRIKF